MQILRENQGAPTNRENLQKIFIIESAKNNFNKLRQPTVGALRKGTKILKLLFLNQRPVLITQLPYLSRR